MIFGKTYKQQDELEQMKLKDDYKKIKKVFCFFPFKLDNGQVLVFQNIYKLRTDIHYDYMGKRYYIKYVHTKYKYFLTLKEAEMAK